MGTWDGLGESVDRLVTLDVRPGGSAPGITVPLYEGVRQAVGRPLTLLAAERLEAAVRDGGAVLITTGFVHPPYFPHGETDGPPGAAALALALREGFACRVGFVAEEETWGAVRAACDGVGLRLFEPADAVEIPRGACLLPFPKGAEAAKAEAARMLDRWRPRAVVAVEKIGRNARSVYHTALGTDMTATCNGADFLVEAAAGRGILTIGIADVGNEIGMGRYGDLVRRVVQPFGARCNCPCGAGIATVVETEVTVVAAISNWGAYGMLACLAAMRGDATLLHPVEAEARMVQACRMAGALDGGTGGGHHSVDGVVAPADVAVVALLHELVRLKTRPYFRQRT